MLDIGEFVEVSSNESGPWQLVKVVQTFTDKNDPDNNLGASTWVESDGENLVCRKYWGGYNLVNCEGERVIDYSYFRLV